MSIFKFDRQLFLATGQMPFRPIQHVVSISFLTTRAVLDTRHLNKASSYPLSLSFILDRTGVGAALILLVLGVSEETVIYDHGLSDGFNAERLKKVHERIESYGVQPEKVDPYLKAPRALIVALLGHIRERYGSAANYLKTEAGVDDATLARLRKELLE